MIGSSYSSKLKKIVIIGLFSLSLIISSIYYIMILSENNFNSTSEDDDDSNSLEDPFLLDSTPKGIRLTFIYNYNDSIVVTWYTEKNATEPNLCYSMSADLSPSINITPTSIKFTSNTFLYYAEIIDLQPNTTYHYQVSSDENYKREIMNFTTLPNDEPSNITFLVYGDSRTQRSERSLLAKKIMESFRNKFQFTIHTGDIVEDGTDQNRWNNYFLDTEIINAFKQGVYVEGNHEGGLLTKMYSNLLMYGNQSNRYYYFSYGEIGFIILDSNNDLDSYNDDQTNWLNNTLMLLSQKNKFNFAFLHHPLLNTSRSNPYLQQKWNPLFDKYNVSIIFCGHNHHYERSYPMLNSTKLEYDDSEHYNYVNLDNSIYIITGGAGAPLYNVYPDDYVAETKKAYHFLLVDVKKHSKKTIINIESWELINEFSPLHLIDNITLTKFL